MKKNINTNFGPQKETQNPNIGLQIQVFQIQTKNALNSGSNQTQNYRNAYNSLDKNFNPYGKQQANKIVNRQYYNEENDSNTTDDNHRQFAGNFKTNSDQDDSVHNSMSSQKSERTNPIIKIGQTATKPPINSKTNSSAKSTIASHMNNTNSSMKKSNFSDLEANGISSQGFDIPQRQFAPPSELSNQAFKQSIMSINKTSDKVSGGKVHLPINLPSKQIENFKIDNGNLINNNHNAGKNSFIPSVRSSSVERKGGNGNSSRSQMGSYPIQFPVSEKTNQPTNLFEQYLQYQNEANINDENMNRTNETAAAINYIPQKLLSNIASPSNNRVSVQSLLNNRQGSHSSLVETIEKNSKPNSKMSNAKQSEDNDVNNTHMLKFSVQKMEIGVNEAQNQNKERKETLRTNENQKSISSKSDISTQSSKNNISIEQANLSPKKLGLDSENIQIPRITNQITNDANEYSNDSNSSGKGGDPGYNFTTNNQNVDKNQPSILPPNVNSRAEEMYQIEEVINEDHINDREDLGLKQATHSPTGQKNVNLPSQSPVLAVRTVDSRLQLHNEQNEQPLKQIGSESTNPADNSKFNIDQKSSQTPLHVQFELNQQFHVTDDVFLDEKVEGYDRDFQQSVGLGLSGTWTNFNINEYMKQKNAPPAPAEGEQQNQAPSQLEQNTFNQKPLIDQDDDVFS